MNLEKASDHNRILIVEDEGIIALDIAESIEFLGHEVCGIAKSGTEALLLAKSTQPNLVLMDIHLQGPSDGIEAAMQIKSNFKVPIIFLSAFADDETVERAKLIEPYSYLIKPFEERALKTSIEVALHKFRIDQEMKASSLAREEALQAISHDLKNPLSAIDLGVQLFDSLSPDQPDFSVKIKELFTYIENSTSQMQSLVKHLLDDAKYQSGQFSLRLTEGDLKEVLNNSLRLFYPMANRTRLTIQVEVDSLINTKLFFDTQKISQVLSNLIGNAIKFTPPAGTINLKIKEHPTGVLIEVTNTGPGIQAKHLKSIFERFWRGDDNHKQGAGLGLAISKNIVEAHGGKIWAESSPEKGASFFFTIPANLQHPHSLLDSQRSATY